MPAPAVLVEENNLNLLGGQMGTSQLADALRAAPPAPRRRMEDIFADEPEVLAEVIAAYHRGVMMKDIARLLTDGERRVTDDMVRAYLQRVGAKT
jgi:hypothetical protein